MGRHSAPADDDDEDELQPVGAGARLDLADDAAGTGRHGHDRELPSAQTRLIPVIDAEIAADADAHLAPVVGIPAAEFAPILPGEAVIPPEAAAPVDELDVLDALLAPPTKPRPTPRRTKAEKNAARAMDAAAAAEIAAAPVDVVSPLAEPVDVVSPLAEPVDVVLPEAEPVTAPTAAPSDTKPPHATAADLALLRTDRSLLARVLAGLLVPFVIYVVVMVVVGAHGAQWVIWIWVPTITAGVLAGSFLDVAHKRAADRPAAEPAEV